MSVHQPGFSFEAVELIQELALQHPATPMVAIEAAAASEPLMELRAIRSLLARSDSDLADCFYFISEGRVGVREISETLVSAARTASLIAFRRQEVWRLPQIPQNVRRGIRLEAEMHLVRADLAARAPAMSRYLSNGRSNPRMRLSFALLVLSLEAADGRMARTVADAATLAHSQDALRGPADLSNLSMSQDLQGDAQLIAEQHLTEPAIPLWLDPDK